MNKFFSRAKRKHSLLTANEIKNQRGLKWLGRYLQHPYLWQCNKEAVARAAFIGIFVAALPIPFQMILACILAILIRANLPSAIGLTWISNPITFTPISYLEYKFGQHLLKHQAIAFHSLSYHQLMNDWHDIWQALVLGSISIGLIAGMLAWSIAHVFWRVINRSHS